MIADIYSLSRIGLEQHINAGKELAIIQLQKDGVITEEQAKNAMKEYNIIFAKKSFFNRFWDSIFGEDSKDAIIMTKICDNSIGFIK